MERVERVTVCNGFEKKGFGLSVNEDDMDKAGPGELLYAKRGVFVISGGVMLK